MWDIFVRWLIPFACVSAISLLTELVRSKMRRTKQSDDKAALIEKGIQVLLRAEIIRQYEKWTSREYCPVYAKDALTKAYEAYSGLGGDDVGTEMYKTVIALPTEEPRRGVQIEI